ncbi:hypothetical protein M413DRAFT_442166, partial [Hebeloma cylindrosporum]
MSSAHTELSRHLPSAHTQPPHMVLEISEVVGLSSAFLTGNPHRFAALYSHAFNPAAKKKPPI